MNEAGGFEYDEAWHFFNEGYQKQMQGQIEEAIEFYKKSLASMPTAEAFTFLGWAYSFQGHYDEAIRECQKAIEVDPDFGNPYNDIGAYLIEKGKLDDAIPWLEKAAEAKRYDSHCFPQYNLGRIWEQKGDWQRAIKCYRQALIERSDYTLAKKALTRLQGMLN